MRLTIQQLTLQAGAHTMVASLDLALEAGEVLGILGANGAGKSTLISVLAGLAVPEQGRVMLDNQILAALPPLVRAQYIGLLPQGDEGGFFGSVADFIALGRYPCGDNEGDLSLQLSNWDLLGLAHRTLDTLSGGERQRARMAQLAMQMPQIFLLDEALTYLDPAHQARLLAWARSQADTGKSVVLTLHDPNWAAYHCDRLLFLFGEGRWQIGTPDTLLNPASLEALYGTESTALWQMR